MKSNFFSKKDLGGVDENVLLEQLKQSNAKHKLKPDQEAFSIISFLPRESGVRHDSPSFQPHSVKREYDGEVFSIGDLVTNGTQMKGNILSFEMLNDHVYVNHTWSGVGMNLGSLIKINELPSQHKIGDKVLFSINQKGKDVGYVVSNLVAEVISVHFYVSKVKYDLEIQTEDGMATRIYNVDSCYVEPAK